MICGNSGVRVYVHGEGAVAGAGDCVEETRHFYSGYCNFFVEAAFKINVRSGQYRDILSVLGL